MSSLPHKTKILVLLLPIFFVNLGVLLLSFRADTKASFAPGLDNLSKIIFA
jgi:hypothetical protein